MKGIDLEDLAGRWHILLTNFPMWLKGDKAAPSFNYIPREDGLNDRVQYIKNGKEKSIEGFSKVVTPDNRNFVWRGKGLLWLFRSKWQIDFMARDKSWMIVSFARTLFTPAGYDVVCRQAEPDADSKEHMEQILRSMGLQETLKAVKQDSVCL
ncbi:MAG: lipocalin family protein [Bacteroidetes bacterium]|nr:lipocalin family protein [Bacteroidota bacterium]